MRSMAKLKLGMIVRLVREPDRELDKVQELGFPTCQVSCWDMKLYSKKVVHKLRSAAQNRDIEITTIWAGLPGRYVWNFIDGPSTIGLVPLKTRRMRLKALKKASDFARLVEVESITTHVGFIPENPKEPVYISLIDSLKEAAKFCAENGESFWFETGQETPITLLRTIEDIGAENLGINLDRRTYSCMGKRILLTRSTFSVDMSAAYTPRTASTRRMGGSLEGRNH